MKIKTLYTCDICKTDYSNEGDALKCEKEHCVGKEMKSFRYQAHQKYPTQIEVKFTDGTSRWYKQ